MAFIRIPEQNRDIREFKEVKAYLASIGIDYGHWKAEHEFGPDASDDEILGAYSQEIEDLKSRGGYVTADVINVEPQTPGLNAMLEKFKKEHWHDEDEVRFVIDGHGVFHIHPQNSPVVAIEVEPGDFIRVPRGTWHWFNLCSDKRIKCIRLFQDPGGWTPRYTNSEAEQGFLEVCMGPSFIPPRLAIHS